MKDMKTANSTLRSLVVGTGCAVIAGLLLARGPIVGHAQTQTAGAQATSAISAAEVSKALESARAAKAAGNIAGALATVAGVLKRDPANAPATEFLVSTYLEQGRIAEALAGYDAHVAARKRPDGPMLAAIGRADLKRVWQAAPNQPILMANVLERLARDGDAAALNALKQRSSSNRSITTEELAPTISLARLKDPEGITKLNQLLGAPTPEERAQVIQAIAAADARSLTPAVIGQLGDGNTMVRTAAVVALGNLQARQAIPQLQGIFDNDVPAVKMFAAVSLKRLGQSTADTFLAGLLNGQIAELRVIAAGAYQSTSVVARGPAWDKAVRELMASPNEQHRLQAAEMLACCDVAAARTALRSALSSPNPLLRSGAAKIFEARPELADLAIARGILGDALDPVRLYGAGLAMTLAKTGTPARGRGAAVSTSR